MATNEVSANLDTFIKTGLNEALKKGMAKACAVIQESARRNCPKGRTGELQNSIDFQVSEDGLKGVVYSNLNYAPYIEVGTGIYATKGQGRQTPWCYPYYEDGQLEFAWTVGQEPRPYLEPAAQENTTRIRDCFEGLI